MTTTPTKAVRLADYDAILCNSSGGKDSQVMTDVLVCQAREEEKVNGVPAGTYVRRIVMAHADLKHIEWDGTKELVQAHADHYGLRLEVVERKQGHLLQHFKDRHQQLQGAAQAVKDALDTVYTRQALQAAESDLWEMTLAEIGKRSEYAEKSIRRRAKKLDRRLTDSELMQQAKDWKATPPWSSNVNRYCTSDHKRGPCSTIVTRITDEIRARRKNSKKKVKWLNCFGFRAEESPRRKKLPQFSTDQRLSNTKRVVHVWLPIQDWTTEQVWQRIRSIETNHHWAYDRGMTRLSCRFCIFSPRSQLMVSAMQPENRELFEEYVQFEDECGFTFQGNQSLREVKEAIERGEQPEADTGEWNM